MEKLKRFARKTTDNVQKASKVRNVQWTVDRLVVTNGSVDYTLVRGTQDPFRMHMTDMNYAAEDIALDALDNLFSGADLHALVDLDGRAVLEKNGSATPSTFSFTGINLSYLDRLFDQTDSLVIAGGRMDLHASSDRPNKKIQFTAEIKDLKVDINKNAASREFLFIPMDRLLKYIQSKKGNLSVTFTMDDDHFEASQDLDFLAKEIWNGLLAAIAKELQVKTIQKFPQNL
jgi:hypothetical protein